MTRCTIRTVVDDNGPPFCSPADCPAQPVAYNTLHRWLRQLEFPLVEARVSALRQLVLQAPAPVFAGALGVHQTITTRQYVHAGATWNRLADALPGCPRQPA